MPLDTFDQSVPISGIDGCRGGWYVIEAGHDWNGISGRVHASFEQALLAIPAHSVVAIDIPIGLQRAGARACDSEARRMLGPTRASSVFPAPLRSVLDAISHAEASAIRREIEGKGMSIQAYAITAKVREVDATLRASPERAARVFEIHPEISFAAMNDSQPLNISKKRAQGRRARLEILANEFGEAPARLIADRQKGIVEVDDVLDAFVACWTARRIVQGVAKSLPAVPIQDEYGQRMTIFF